MRPSSIIIVRFTFMRDVIQSIDISSMQMQPSPSNQASDGACRMMKSRLPTSSMNWPPFLSALCTRWMTCAFLSSSKKPKLVFQQ